MEKQDAVSEEIVIVGSRHGELADIVKPIYEKGDPIDERKISELLGLERVILWPSDEDFDKYGVRVLTEDLRPIGHVWMCQSPAVLRWLQEKRLKYLKVRITRICVTAGVLMAKSESPLALEETERCVAKMDRGWAADLPEVLKSLTEQSLGLGLQLLRDELEESEQWSPRLEMRIDNLLKSLPLDLSGHHYRDCIDLYKTMMASDDAEVRMQGELVLKSVVHRGSPDQMQWWVENWLPDFLRMAAEGDLLGIFESARYTLEDVEELLRQAPANLFHLYQANRHRFVRELYYSALPQPLYNRLLTLLAVREAMLKRNGGKNEQEEKLNARVLAKALAACSALIWGNAAYSVPFCVCRDHYSVENNATSFERLLAEAGIEIPEGTINAAFSRNPWLKYHTDKWKENDVPRRALRLRDAIIEGLDAIMQQKISL